MPLARKPGWVFSRPQHPRNPVKGFTLPQVDCIFSSTRKSGYDDIVTWGEP